MSSFIELRNIKNEKGWFMLRAYLNEKGLLLEGQDFDEEAEKIFGDEEYEYWYDFDAENTKKLFEAIGCPPNLDDAGKLAFLKEWFHEDVADCRLLDLCQDKGIEYGLVQM